MVRGVIFDMDGVLVDTESCYASRRREFLLSKGMPYQDSWDFTGFNKQASWAVMVPEAGLRERLIAEYDTGYCAKHPIPFAQLADPEARPLLQQLKAQGRKIGIASSSAAGAIERMAEALGIAGYVDFAVSGEDCPAHKPDPAVYLQALKGLGLAPGEALAVEDSPTGIQAAKRAGIFTLALSAHCQGRDQSEADAVIARLEDVLEFVT